jgi:antitoxin ChpS
MLTTNLRKVGRSVMIALPRAVLDTLRLRAGSTDGLDVVGGRLIIDPIPQPRYTLEDLLAASDCTDPLTEEERAWVDAPSVGREI